MTTLLEAVRAIIEEGIKITTIFTLLLLWRKHVASKRMKRDIEAIKKAVGVCVEKNDSLLSTVRSLSTSSWAGRLSVLHADASIAKGSTTILKESREMKKLLSRKFLMAVVAGVLIIANDGLSLNLDTTTITAFCSIVVGYIVGEAATDVAKVRANVSNGGNNNGLDASARDSEDI